MKMLHYLFNRFKNINSEKKVSNHERGFTLIELLVVIFIIGVLAAIIVPNFMSARERGRDSRRKQDLNNIRNALQMYYNDAKIFPEEAGWKDEISPDFITAIPQDPSPGRDYGYCVTANLNSMVLCADLENKGDSDLVTLDNSGCSGLCDPGCGAVDEEFYFICLR